MIKQKAKVRAKKKNPFTNIEDVKDYVSKNSYYFKFIDAGMHAKVYKFKTNKKLVLNSKILQHGDYTLKLIQNEKHYLNSDQIEYLSILSKYGLIPKLFIITKNYIIGNYIDGYTLKQIEDYYDDGEITGSQYSFIFRKLDELSHVWEKLGFHHGDLHFGNVLISKNFKHVYLIDPKSDLAFTHKSNTKGFK